jgi:hypothetical protein
MPRSHSGKSSRAKLNHVGTVSSRNIRAACCAQPTEKQRGYTGSSTPDRRFPRNIGFPLPRQSGPETEGTVQFLHSRNFPQFLRRGSGRVEPMKFGARLGTSDKIATMRARRGVEISNKQIHHLRQLGCLSVSHPGMMFARKSEPASDDGCPQALTSTPLEEIKWLRLVTEYT